jgi:hypothetical protein
MKFKYYLSGHGWALLDIEINGFSPEPHYRDAYCGGLYELLKQIVEVLDLMPIEDNSGEDEINWQIDQEGTLVNFDFTLNESKDKAVLRITQLFYGDVDSECVFNGEINFSEFVIEIIKSCDEILEKYGIIGFFANATEYHDFPITHYLLLKNWLNEKIKVTTVYEILPCDKEDDDKESDLYRTDINKEWEVIKDRGYKE